MSLSEGLSLSLLNCCVDSAIGSPLVEDTIQSTNGRRSCNYAHSRGTWYSNHVSGFVRIPYVAADADKDIDIDISVDALLGSPLLPNREAPRD